MPPPPQKPYWFDTAGLSAEQIAGIEPDYLYFLRHVRLEADAYMVEIPSKDGASPPVVVRYEEPLAGPNAEAAVDGSEHGDLGGPSFMGMDSSVAAAVPSGAAPPPAVVPVGGGIGCRAVPAEADDTAPPATEPAWFDSQSDIDDSYRLFLERSSEEQREEQAAAKAIKVEQTEEQKGEQEEEEEEEQEEKVEEVVKDHNEEVEVNGEANTEKKQAQPSMEASSSQQHNASELEGTIWPTHIIERQESDFKKKLIKALAKPFSREEYDNLFAMATKRSPITKERMTRSNTLVFYTSEHQMGKSYFDNYPDLADQVNGESSYANRLALLRGLFFWLKHAGHDDKFRPWSGDFKTYRVREVEDDLFLDNGTSSCKVEDDFVLDNETSSCKVEDD